jgi:hypothetical protein
MSAAVALSIALHVFLIDGFSLILLKNSFSGAARKIQGP